jgi:hypothetical protein
MRTPINMKDWPGAEVLAREALRLSENVGRHELIAENCARLAIALARQEQKTEGRAYARRAVDIYADLHSPKLEGVRATLRECEA